MNSFWLLTLYISVFLTIMIFTNCEGHPANYPSNLHNPRRHHDKRHLDPQLHSLEIQSTGSGYEDPTAALIRKSDGLYSSFSQSVSESNESNEPCNLRSSTEDSCLTPECIHTASRVLNYIDPKVEPCDNFYQFACGNFLKSRVIPDDKTSINTFMYTEDKIAEQLRIILEEESKPDEPKPFRVAKSLYKSCMNKSAIEEKGLKVVLDILNKLGGWPVLESDLWQEEKFDWKQSVYELRELGFTTNYFLSLNVAIDLKNNTKRILKIDIANLSLPPSYLVKGLSDKIVDAYYRYMIDIAVILGANRTRAEKELKESLEFEMKLANISFPQEERRNIIALYNPMTLKDLKGNYSTIPWSEYINKILKIHPKIDDEDVVIVVASTYFQKFEKLMQQTSKKIQANYVLWRAVKASANFLTEEIRKRLLDYYNAIAEEIIETKARWKECLAFTYREMGESVGALYVRKYFNEESKNSVVEMVSNIRQELNKILQEVHWMDNKTRMNALEKADAMSSLIAYPDELLDDNKLVEFYDKLEITSDDFYRMILNISLFRTEYSFSQLRKPVEKMDWLNFDNPVDVNAFYSPDDNSIQLTAGILQEVFFNSERPRYMNYGAIGWIIGHEMTHGIDNRGGKLDKEGNLVEWWEPETKKEYLKKAECFIHQYGNYTAEVGLNLNGNHTQQENIADNGGIKEAYLAYQEWVKRNSRESKLPGLNYTSSQLFWISAAQMWCSKDRPETLRFSITNDEHSLEEFRVLGSFSNRPEFAKDFNCKMGSRMNPEKKCNLW